MGIVRGFHSFDEQFTQIPNAWLRDPRLSFRAIGLLAQIMSHSQGWSISIASLATTNREGKDAIRSAVHELEAAGYLVREQENNGRFGEAIWFTTDPAEIPSSEIPTSGNPHTKNNNIKEKQVKETYGDFDVVFDRFWSVYPRKENKQSARRAFRKALTVASVDVILAGATRFGSDPNLPETQFIPHAATWLNQERWDNPPLPERVLSPEQRAEIEAAKRRSQLERDRQATEQYLAEQRELAEQVRLNPPKRCEHDRIEVICPRCNTKLNN